MKRIYQSDIEWLSSRSKGEDQNASEDSEKVYSFFTQVQAESLIIPNLDSDKHLFIINKSKFERILFNETRFSGIPVVDNRFDNCIFIDCLLVDTDILRVCLEAKKGKIGSQSLT